MKIHKKKKQKTVQKTNERKELQEHTFIMLQWYTCKISKISIRVVWQSINLELI